MRHEFRARWLRVYSLPNGKRVPSDDEERLELLRRHLTVSMSILGEGSLCAAIVAYEGGYQGEEEPPSVQRLGTTVIQGWEQQWLKDKRFVDDLEATSFALAQCSWRRGKVEDLIRDAAYGHTAPLLFVALDTGRVYSPYDGGADLFVENEETRNTLRTRFCGWASMREDGL